MQTKLLLFAALLCSSSLLMAQIPTTGLVAYYPFSGSTADASGHGFGGTAMGSPTFVNDRNGMGNSAYRFDGIDDYIALGSWSAFQFGSADEYTLTAWVLADTMVGGTSIISCSPANDNTWTYGMWLFGDGQVGQLTGGSACSSPGYGSDIAAFDANWDFFAISYQSGYISLYVNGELQLREHRPACDATGELSIGRRGGMTNGYFDGAIDDVAIYSRALSHAEIAEMFLGFAPCTSFSAALDPINYMGSCNNTVSLSWSGANDMVDIYSSLVTGNLPVAQVAASDMSSVTSGVCDGFYTWVLHDTYGCIDTFSFWVGTPCVGFSVSLDTLVGVGCNTTGMFSTVAGNFPMDIETSWAGGTGMPLVAYEAGFNIPGMCPESYTVIVTDAGGCMDTISFSVLSGLATLADKEPLTLFPNPATQLLQVSFGETPIDASLELYSVDGRLLKQFHHIQEPVYTLSVADLPEGLYYVRTLANKQTKIGQFVKQ